MSEFTHLDEKGNVRMVDVTVKPETDRRAVAKGTVLMSRKTFEIITHGQAKKGNVLETARIAGIMAAKKTWDLIPMCHPLAITHAVINFFPDETRSAIHIQAEVRVKSQTGVEMEALTAVSVAALTLYDMCKSYDKAMMINDVCLMEKSGGKSGHYKRDIYETT
ncbi:MAG: cyclic pyranopterin monophosphate synthase MoaC [Proteobacteria bacterium]|nr:cyclic pyranopterin monophosphate synthase MoaC [Pseudomonadota bacterium]